MSNPDAYYDPPTERAARCECGHSEEYHGDRNELDNDHAYELLEMLYDKVAFYDATKSLGQIARILERQLAVCGGKNCECHRFVESRYDDPKKNGGK
jgi:hypothetical protein